MGISRRFAGNGSHAKSLAGVEGGAFHLAVVKDEAFGLPVFQEQLAVVGSMQRIIDDALNTAPVHSGTGKKQFVGDGKISHGCVLNLAGPVAMGGGLRQIPHHEYIGRSQGNGDRF